MLKLLLLSAFVGVAVSAETCIRCICLRESGCKPMGCQYDTGSIACGYYQIKEPEYIDCGQPGKKDGESTETAWKRCVDDYDCATTCVLEVVYPGRAVGSAIYCVSKMSAEDHVNPAPALDNIESGNESSDEENNVREHTADEGEPVDSDNEEQSPLSDEDRFPLQQRNSYDAQENTSLVLRSEATFGTPVVVPSQPPKKSAKPSGPDPAKAAYCPEQHIRSNTAAEPFGSQCKAVVRFDIKDMPRTAIDISNSVCDPTALCANELCASGISFAEGYPAVPTDLRQFATWQEVLQPWEIGYRTRYLFVFLDNSVTEELIIDLFKLSAMMHGAFTFVIAPFISPSTTEAVLQLRPKFIQWQKRYYSPKFHLCGWRDGKNERSLVYALEQTQVKQPLLVNSSGFLTGYAAKRMLDFFNAEYELNIQTSDLNYCKPCTQHQNAPAPTVTSDSQRFLTARPEKRAPQGHTSRDRYASMPESHHKEPTRGSRRSFYAPYPNHRKLSHFRKPRYQ